MANLSQWLIFVTALALCNAKLQCSVCGKNEQYEECGTVASCEANCENPTNFDKICPLICLSGCFCKPGFVRDIHRNCIPVAKCSSADCTGKNEQYQQCGSTCQPTCAKPVVTICNKACRAACNCIQGFVKNTTGSCVKLEDCPPNP